MSPSDSTTPDPAPETYADPAIRTARIRATPHRLGSFSPQRLISAETQNHSALLRHKRGLIQQLFPSPEEVEG